MRDPAAVAAALDRAASKAGVAYIVVGGLAVSAWGQPRATQGVDIVLDVPADRTDPFLAALAREGLVADPQDFRAARSDQSHVTVFDRDSQYHVDCKLARTNDEKQQVQRDVTLELEEGPLRVASAEDTIVYKLSFGSPQDRQDTRSILVRRAGRLDRDRMRALAARLGVEGELDDLLRSHPD